MDVLVVLFFQLLVLPAIVCCILQLRRMERRG